MTTTMEVAAEKLKDLDRLRKEQELVIRKINSYHSKLQQTPEVAETWKDDLWMKLRSYYNKAKSLAEEEVSVSQACIEQLNGLLPGPTNQPTRKKPGGSMLQSDPNEKKRKRVRPDADSARLSSPTQRTTNPAYANLLPGDQVAGRITTDDADTHEWIVVKITRVDRETNKYEVFDEEPDEEGHAPRKYKLPALCIIPLPKRSDVSSAPDFPVGSSVLAVYPGTTTLYKAAIVAPQRKKRTDDYSLQFDGDEEEGIVGLPTKTVPFYHVVQLPINHR